MEDHIMKKMLLMMVVTLCLTVTANAVIVYDLGADWEKGQPIGSGGANPNGVWSYGYSTELTKAAFSENTGYDEWDANAGVWWAAPGTWSLIWHSFSRTDGNGSIDPGDTVIQTGVNNPGVNGVIRWTAPAQGVIDINMIIEQGYGNSSGALVLNDTVLQTFDALAVKNDTHNYSAENISVAKGDTLDLVIVSGTVYSSLVKVNEVITFTVSTLPPAMDIVMQLDAGAGVTDSEGSPIAPGQVVNVWEDQAGGSLDAQVMWGNPTLESGTFPNGQHNVIRFTGDDGFVIYDLSDPNMYPEGYPGSDPNSGAPLDLETYTIYVVGKLNQETNFSQVFLSNYSQSNGYILGISDTLPDHVKFWSSMVGEIRSSGAISDTNRYYLLTATIDNTFKKRLYVNDCMEDEATAISTYTKTTVASLGALGNGSQFLKGDIAEIRVYNGFIEPTHLAIVNELVDKYGLNRECLGGPNPDRVSLSALTLYGATDTGALRTQEQWNTYYPDDPWDITLTDKSIAELQALTFDPNDPFPEALNVASNMSIFENLTKGQTYTYTYMVPTPFNYENRYYGMNFYFDSAQTLGGNPGISVLANMTGVGETPEPFQANNNAVTMGWPYPAVTPGAGTLIYKDFVKGLSVTLTDWVVYHPDVYGLDMVRPYVSGVSNGPDGSLDVVGQFTLRVDPYFPTCEDMIAMGGEYLPMDFDKNCYVDMDDFALFALQWLECNDPANADCTMTTP